jgi:hypothetical protein
MLVYQSQLSGFAVLPTSEPKAAAGLSLCLKELGFVGAAVNNYLEDGRFYEDEHF